MAGWVWKILPAAPLRHGPALGVFVPSKQRDIEEGEGGHGAGVLSYWIFFYLSALHPSPLGLEISFAGG